MNGNPILPAPDALPLPAPAPLLHGLLLLTFYLHLLFMNGLVGGAVLTFWSHLRARRPGAEGAGLDLELARRVGRLLPTLTAGTITFGVAPLLFLQTLYGQFFFTSSILMAWPWLSVIPVLVLAYYGVYLNSFRGDRLGAARAPLLAVVCLLLLAIAFIYTNNATLMLRPDRWAALHFASAGGGALNLGDPQVIPRWLHMILGAVAVGGLLLAVLGQWTRKRAAGGGDTGGDAAGARMRSVGLGALAYLTMANFLVGMWFLIALRRDVMMLFMGGSPHGTGLLGLGLVLSFAIILLALRARQRSDDGLWPVAAVTLLTVALMVLMRDLVRAGYLAEHYRPETFAVQTQGLNLALFALLLVAGLAIVFWMVRRLLDARPQ